MFTTANFQDSKEIMMTSDSESDYKYSSSNSVPFKTTPPLASTCPMGELRCVSGKCITISQLCDKVSNMNYDHFVIVSFYSHSLIFRSQIVLMGLTKQCVYTKINIDFIIIYILI